MRKLKISNRDVFTIIDESDYEIVSLFTWLVDSNGYVYAKTWLYNKQSHLSLHRLVANAPRGMSVDHINHNKLDNRKSNLRVCTHKQNLMNSRSNKGLSEYKGVSWHKGGNKWCAYICPDGKAVHLGLFYEEEAAAQAYNIMARKYFGEYAHYNNIETEVVYACI